MRPEDVNFSLRKWHLRFQGSRRVGGDVMAAPATVFILFVDKKHGTNSLLLPLDFWLSQVHG